MLDLSCFANVINFTFARRASSSSSSTFPIFQLLSQVYTAATKTPISGTILLSFVRVCGNDVDFMRFFSLGLELSLGFPMSPCSFLVFFPLLEVEAVDLLTLSEDQPSQLGCNSDPVKHSLQ